MNIDNKLHRLDNKPKQSKKLKYQRNMKQKTYNNGVITTESSLNIIVRVLLIIPRH